MPTPPGQQDPHDDPGQHEEFAGSEEYPSRSSTPAPGRKDSSPPDHQSAQVTKAHEDSPPGPAKADQ